MTTSALVVYRRSECPGGPAAAFGTIAPVFRLVILNTACRGHRRRISNMGGPA